jgi:hypothetical protein
MAWARLDDSFFDHPKIECLSDRAFRAYIGGICLANRYLTDGLLTERQMLKLARKQIRKELIDSGLWEPVDACNETAGVRIHDFAEYNRTAEEVKAERQRNAERQKRWREERRNGVTNGVTDAVTDGVSNAAPTRPDPSRPGVKGFKDKDFLPFVSNSERRALRGLEPKAALREVIAKAEERGVPVPNEMREAAE